MIKETFFIEGGDFSSAGDDDAAMGGTDGANIDTDEAIDRYIEQLQEFIGDEGGIKDFQANKSTIIENINRRIEYMRSYKEFIKQIKQYPGELSTEITYENFSKIYKEFSSIKMTFEGDPGYKKFLDAIDNNITDTDINAKVKDVFRQLLSKAIKGLETAPEEEVDQLVNDNSSGSDSTREPSDQETEELNRKLNDMIKKIEKMNKEKTTTSWKDVREAIWEFIKLAIPIFEIWFVYNLIRYSLSHCEWKPTNNKCKFDDKVEKEWVNKQITAQTLPKNETQAKFTDYLTFSEGDTSRKTCVCNDTKILQVASDPSNKLSYGTISAVGNNTLSSKTCNQGDQGKGGSIACQPNYPVCLQAMNANPDDRDSANKCNGTYEFYDCDLSEMINKFAQAASGLLNVNLSGIVKLLIYIFVGIIVFYLLISILRYMFSSQKK